MENYICINSQKINLTEEQVAAELLNLDRAAHLTRTGGIW